MTALGHYRSRPQMAAVAWKALGTTAIVRAAVEDLAGAQRAASRIVAEVDDVANRFRENSEISRISRAAGARTAISARMYDLLQLAMWAAEVSEGAVDPTLGNDLVGLGYDRDFAQLARVAADQALTAPARDGSSDRPSRPWRDIALTREPLTVTLPAGIRLDLGATAKGRAADLAADAAYAAVGGPVLISLGGDIAVAGPPPPDGWRIGIATDHRDAADDTAQTVTISSGGLATSSLVPRRWWYRGRPVHHVLNPEDGQPVHPHWRTVSVTAATCAEANTAATAALVLGPLAPQWLDDQAVPARLVAADGSVTRIAGWPP